MLIRGIHQIAMMGYDDCWMVPAKFYFTCALGQCLINRVMNELGTRNYQSLVNSFCV